MTATEDAVERLPDTADAGVLFIAGREENQARFRPWSGAVILLSVPAGVIARRLAAGAANSHGKGPGELRRVLDDVQAPGPGCAGWPITRWWPR